MVSTSPVPEVHLVVGTRPEAIKLAPVALDLARSGRMKAVVLATGQHPTMVHQALAAFGVKADATMRLDRVDGGLVELYAQLLPQLDALWADRPPAAVVVQGDTSSTVAGALAAFWRRVPVVHLEAGLRSFDLDSPFPEEANRRMVGAIARLHLAPTERAANNLRREGVAEDRLLVVGNTVVDAVGTVVRNRTPFGQPDLAAVEARALSGNRRLLLVTVHRRESWGEPLAGVLNAVRTIVREHQDVEVVLPAHPNPQVRDQVRQALGDCQRVTITEPLDYPDLVRLLAASTLVLSDSGGIQEEAPSFKVPVMVLRDVTERQEAVDAGCALLVGTDEERVTAVAGRLLGNPAFTAQLTASGNPFGDGLAGERTEQALAVLLGLAEQMPDQFVPQATEVRLSQRA
ncbi:UDP-N-acetylglucosamine 2-epimerase (non-hydrolyzing) [Solihabitans fulvus]|uniref:UDP-N-acetylglucosamine 2-epimerase (non-hydrolyzing) n=1 Tax=Solihabitans fulvus TaxID=1892852 RepID=A0A5B2XFZ4_9PSEU|nr:UDP-N-acetylglucosamine 2-epimerase (non-hydrolyzing) [Solihabitans fulvus]